MNKKNYFEFHEPGKYTRHYEYPYQIGPLAFITILTRRHLTCTCHVLWPNGGKQRWEIQLHVYLQIETMNRSSMRFAKMLLHTITFQAILHNFLMCSLSSCALCSPEKCKDFVWNSEHKLHGFLSSPKGLSVRCYSSVEFCKSSIKSWESIVPSHCIYSNFLSKRYSYEG